MKTTLLALGLIFVVNASASIEYSANDEDKATEAEVAKNRACFQELINLGCGDPGEDPQHFRSCLSNVHSSLTSTCKSMMTELYGKQ